MRGEVAENALESHPENLDHVMPPGDVPGIGLWKLRKAGCNRERILRRIRHGPANVRLYCPCLGIHELLYLDPQVDRRTSEVCGQPQATEDQCAFEEGVANVDARLLESTDLLGIAVLGEHLLQG